jgi:cellulose synthase/poly-beta-1,6-N-acetylglucosamine synthase-like glycosyltransferase
MSTSYPNQAEVSTDRDSGNHPLPKISIVTINYNRLADLKKTFNNVISLKNFHEYEYIIVDGGSSDGSVDFLTENSELISQWVSEPDRATRCAEQTGSTNFQRI